MKNQISKHIEYTVTLACPAYDSGNPCPGCYLPKQPEEALVGDPRFKENSDYQIDPAYVINILHGLYGEGYRLITLMGGEPLAIKKFNEVIGWVSDSSLTGALYVGLPKLFLNESDELNDHYRLYKEAGLFNKDKFGYVKFSVNNLLLDKSKIPIKNGPDRTSALKTFYGLRVAELLAEEGMPPTIHQTVTRNNIDQTLPLYYWAKERNICFSFSPMVWSWRSPKFETKNDLEKAFSFRLTEEHAPQLTEISKVIFSEAVEQITKNKKRLIVPSSAFLRLLPKYGINNSISCFPVNNNIFHRNGRQPEIRDVYPNGIKRYCIAQDTEEEAKKCFGCFGSAGVDRSNCYYDFESLIVDSKDIRFLNGDEYRKASL